jgi:AAA+ ATPase superfamily predicted ATPase
MNKNKISTALISVFDKTGLEPLVKELNKNGVTIYSTGGTLKFIEKLNIPVVSVESLTEFPEILGGRVKTLHPNVFGGILNRRDNKSDQKEIKKHKIPRIDLVIVDLYPFEETVASSQSHEDIIEKIDIGGISLIRAAAKNYNDVAIVSCKEQYESILSIISDDCSTTLDERERLAIDAFSVTSEYDSHIFSYLSSESDDVLDAGAFDVFSERETKQSNLSININKDYSNLNDFLYCWDIFGSRPNKIVIHNTYSTKPFAKIVSEHSIEKNIFTEILPNDEDFTINDKIISNLGDDVYLSYIVIDRNQDNSIVSDIVFFYKSQESSKKVQSIIEELNDCLVDFCEEETNNLNTIALSTQSGLEIEPIELDDDFENFDHYYSSNTGKSVEKLIKKIKKSNKGLSVLYGERGTGKTSVINYIASKLDRIVIFIPNNLIEHTINNPDFRKFIKKFQKPVIVLDDCELTLSDYYNRTNITTNNILQMVDGFLSDTMEVNIICIFNTDDEDDIDEALLDCNSLIDVIEFEYLSGEESEELSKVVGSGKKYKNKTRLIDIIKKKSGGDQKKIGF